MLRWLSARGGKAGYRARFYDTDIALMPANRRTFLLAGGGALMAHAAAPADQIVIGVIGSGGRGTLVMTTFQKDATVRVGAICDVFEPNLEKALSLAKGAKAYRNYKDLLA